MNHDAYDDAYIRGILDDVRTIAMVGASANNIRPSYFVLKYLIEKGYRLFPINPGLAGKEILGQKVHGSLAEVPVPIDMVDVFRNSEAAGAVVDEALALVEQRGRPKLVVTDIHLGASNGLELVRSIRAEFGNEVPILVVSGLTDDAIAEQVRRAGATDFVTKPVGRRALFARIQSVLPPSTFAERSGRQI